MLRNALAVLALLSLEAVQAQGKQVVRVYLLQSDLGGSSFNGSIRDTFFLALEQRQAALGKLGYEVNVQSLYNGSSDVVRAREDAAQAATDPSVLFAFSTLDTEATQAWAAKGIPTFHPTNTDGKLTSAGGMVFRMSGRNDALARGVGQFIEHLGARKVVVVDDASDGARQLSAGLQNYAKGGAVQVLESLSLKAPISDAQLARIKTLAPEVIYANFDKGLDAAQFVNRLNGAGLRSVTVGGSAFADKTFLSLMGKNVGGVYYTSFAPPVLAYPNTIKFAKAFETKTKQTPIGVSLLTYDTMMLSLDALEDLLSRRKLPTRASFLGVLRQTSVNKQLTGDIAFTPSGERQKNSVFVMEFGKDMKPRVIFTTTLENKK